MKMAEIEKIKEDLYIQKGLFGYKIVYPIKKDLDRPLSLENINWKNLLIGSWKQFLTLIIFLAIIFFFIWAYKHDMAVCQEMLKNPCQFCKCSVGFA